MSEQPDADLRRFAPGRGSPWPRVVLAVTALIAVVVVMAIVATGLVVYGIGRSVAGGGEASVNRVLDEWRAFTQPQWDRRVADFLIGLPDYHEDTRLVVMRMALTKEMYAEDTKHRFGINLGTTRVSLTVPVTVHYAIDFSGQKPIIFRAASAEPVFHAVFPDPEVLAIEFDDRGKRTLVDVGWGRLRERSGAALLRQLERGRYDAVMRDATAPEILDTVREKARPVLARFVANFLLRERAVGADGFQDIAIGFSGDPAGATAPRFSVARMTAPPDDGPGLEARPERDRRIEAP